MGIIIDPDEINIGTEIAIDRPNRTITLNIAGNLDVTGVSMQALYSFLKEEWSTDNNLIKYTFPMNALTPEQFEVGNNGFSFSDWTFADDATRKLIRNGGWREYNKNGDNLREYMGVITLGSIDSVDKNNGDRAYYFFTNDANVTEFTYAGSVNESIQIYGDTNNGAFDNRDKTLFIKLRQAGKTFSSSTSIEIGVSKNTYKVERFPLSEQTDGSIEFIDSEIDSSGDGTADVAPFNGMSITYYGTEQSATVGSTPYGYNILVDGNGGTKEEIYAFVQWKLRQDADIDDGAGTVLGLQAEDLIKLEGGTLKTLLQSDGTVVFVDNFDAVDTNSIQYTDANGNAVTFPYVAAGKLVFNTNLLNDVSAKYWLFFEDANGNRINTDNAIIVKDKDGQDITGLVSGTQEISFTFDYDGNIQGGRTAQSDASVVLKALGLTTAQYSEQRYQLTRSNAMSFSAVSPLERNFSNPA